MKNALLVMVVSALLVTLGLAQTPDAVSNTDPATVKGCLGGSDGNYTVAEDGTRQIVKISTSSVDLKPHLGHDVKLVGHKASGAASADSSFAVTELSMISEQCAAAAAPASTIIPPGETVIAPDPAAPVPPVVATAPAVDTASPATPVAPAAATASAPAVDAAAPAAPVTPPVATVVTPVVEAVAPIVKASPSSATVGSPAAEAAPAPRPSAHPRKLAAAQAEAATARNTVVSPSPEPAGSPAADVTTPATTASPSAEADRAADAAAAATPAPAPAPAPAPKETHRASSLPLLIAFVVLVIVLGTTAPLIGRWRKRKMLERDGSPNLSFNNDVISTEVSANEASSDQDRPGPRKVA